MSRETQDVREIARKLEAHRAAWTRAAALRAFAGYKRKERK